MANYLRGLEEEEHSVLPEGGPWGPHDHVVVDINWSGNAAAAAAYVAKLSRLGPKVTVIDSMPPDHFISFAGGAPDPSVTPYLNAPLFCAPPEAMQWLHGGRVAIIDPEIPTGERSGATASARILVSCGGPDPENLTGRAVLALARAGHSVDVVIGPMFSDGRIEDLRQIASSSQNSANTFHHHSDGLGPLLRRASLVVDRVGIMRYEAASLGLRGIYLHYGSQYREYLNGFSESGVAEIFFADDRDGEANFLRRLANLSDGDFLPNPRARDLVDGKGAERVVQAVLNLNEHSQ